MELNFENKSTKELKDTLKLLKVISIFLSCIILLLVSFSTYGMVTKQNNSTFVALFVVGISCGAILPMQFTSIKKIKNEIQNREK